jgi:putative hydrolases of HD superfamily
MELSIEDLLKFSRFLLEFQSVRRKIRIPGREDYENDAEHSYSLAMIAWYINEVSDLRLDTSKVLKYALVHDIPEVYAGDPAILDKKGRSAKKQKEAAAIEHIEAQFPSFSRISRWIHEYEKRADPESRFVSALDKLAPNLVIYEEGGSTWHELDYDPEELLGNIKTSTSIDPTIQRLTEQLEKLVRNDPTLFNQ